MKPFTKKEIKQLFNEKLIANLSDLFLLRVSDLVALEGWTQKRACVAINALQEWRRD